MDFLCYIHPFRYKHKFSTLNLCFNVETTTGVGSECPIDLRNIICIHFLWFVWYVVLCQRQTFASTPLWTRAATWRVFQQPTRSSTNLRRNRRRRHESTDLDTIMRCISVYIRFSHFKHNFQKCIVLKYYFYILDESFHQSHLKNIIVLLNQIIRPLTCLWW